MYCVYKLAHNEDPDQFGQVYLEVHCPKLPEGIFSSLVAYVVKAYHQLSSNDFFHVIH